MGNRLADDLYNDIWRLLLIVDSRLDMILYDRYVHNCTLANARDICTCV